MIMDTDANGLAAATLPPLHLGEGRGEGVPSLRSAAFCSPVRDAEFARLPDVVRDEISRTLRSLQVIHLAPNKQHAFTSQSATYHGKRGFSAQSLQRKYYAFLRANGDWRVLRDNAKAGPAFWSCSLDGRSLPPAFIEFWKKLCEDNQRKNKPAHRELLRAWRLHEILDPSSGKRVKLKSIPGYDEWPVAHGDTGIPAGWSYANLSRLVATNKFELAAARHGRDRASVHTRKVFTTRAGLRVGQFFLFDDQEYDVHVNFTGSIKAMRPVGLNVLDLYSACCIAYGFKPVLIDEDGVKKKGLEKHMPFLLAHVLCSKGYRTDAVGTTLIVESGTATIRDEMAERLERLTEGHVRVQRGATSNAPSFAGLFEGASKGNPRFKAALESFFNLVRNEMGALPGQSGMDRDHMPVEHYGRDKYNTKLLKAAQELPPHRRELLKHPFMDWATFTEAAMRVYSDINARTDHELEGWDKCGHIVQEMFLMTPGRQVPLDAQSWALMSADQRAALQAANLLKSLPRRLSPQEVWNSGANDLQPLGNHALPVLLGPEFGTERTVRGGYITIEDQELGADPLRFPSSENLLLRNGDKFLCYLNPFDPTTLVLTDAAGRYIGDLKLQEAPSRADAEAIKRQMGAAKAEEAKRLAPLATRHLDQAKAKRDMHRHNTAVLDGKAVSLEERADACQVAARVKQHGSAALDAILAPAEDAPDQISPESDSTIPDSGDSSLIDNVL